MPGWKVCTLNGGRASFLDRVNDFVCNGQRSTLMHVVPCVRSGNLEVLIEQSSKLPLERRIGFKGAMHGKKMVQCDPGKAYIARGHRLRLATQRKKILVSAVHTREEWLHNMQRACEKGAQERKRNGWTIKRFRTLFPDQRTRVLKRV